MENRRHKAPMLMQIKAWLTKTAQGLAVTIIFFVGLDLLLRGVYFVRNAMVEYVPLPYVAGDDYGPAPPWIDGLRILEPDEQLIWRARPSLRRRYVDVFSPVDREENRTALLRQFVPSIPASLQGNPTWEISLNSRGFRTDEFPRAKDPGALRIVCLGDSWTFGANVGQDQAYPQQLQRLLAIHYPGRKIEVFNLGVLGYSSHQGLELLKLEALGLDPDVVVIGFAMNDSKIEGYRDKDLAGLPSDVTVSKRVTRLVGRIETYKLLRYLAGVRRYKARPLGQTMTAGGASTAKGPQLTADEVYEENEPWTRVSPRDFAANLVEMIERARSRQALAILLNNQLEPDNPYTSALQRVSQNLGVPLVDSSALIAEAKARMEEDLERRLDLGRAAPGDAARSSDVDVVFRVTAGSRPVAKALYIVGPPAQLGRSAPNTVTMYDDGTHGDERTADGVWSYSAAFPRGSKISYIYTNSGTPGQWEGLDVPHIRILRVPRDGEADRIRAPIDTFGTIYMQADSWHTNAAGYQLIARAVRDAIGNSVGGGALDTRR